LAGLLAAVRNIHLTALDRFLAVVLVAIGVYVGIRAGKGERTPILMDDGVEPVGMLPLARERLSHMRSATKRWLSVPCMLLKNAPTLRR
jgi:hypothetical protein